MAIFRPIEGRDHGRIDPEVSLRDEQTKTSSDRADGCTVDRAEEVSLDDWELLGRSQQQFVKHLLVFCQLGKRAIAERGARLVAEQSAEQSDEVIDLVERGAARHHRHDQLLGDIIARLGEDDRIRLKASETLFHLVDRARPDDEEVRDRSRVPVKAATGTVLVDVMFDTALAAVETLLERNGTLPELTELVSRLRDEDRAARDQRIELLEAFRDRDARTCDVIDGTLDRAVMPVLKSIRSMQRKFDLIQMGLVPDEFVAQALERLFNLNAAPSVRPGAMPF